MSICKCTLRPVAILLLLGISRLSVLQGQISEPCKGLGDWVLRDVPFSENKPVPLELSKSYGYVIGVELMTERIAQTYPDLSNPVRKNLLAFMEAWCSSATRIKWALEPFTQMTPLDFDSLIIESARPLINGLPLDRQIANDFIQQLAEKAVGKYIESPVLETLLIYRFPAIPSDEMDAGFSQRYHAEDSPGALGLSFSARLPITWAQKEERPPNVVDMFVSENGRGREAIGFTIFENEVFTELSEEDLALFLSEEGIRILLPPGAVLGAVKKITLGGKPAVQVIFTNHVDVLDQSVLAKHIMFMTFFEGRQFILGGSVTDIQEAPLAAHFERFLPFFRTVASSLQFD